MTVTELVKLFLDWCADSNRAENTYRFYRDRLKRFVATHGDRNFVDLKPLDIQRYLSAAARKPNGELWAPDTRRGNVLSLERLQSFALEQKLIEQPIFGKLEKPRGRGRDKIPTEAQFAALLKNASPAFTLIFQAFRRCGARPNELCRAQIENIETDETEVDEEGKPIRMIVLQEHKTAAKTGKPRVIVIGKQLGELIDQAIGARKTGAIFMSPQKKQWTPQNLSVFAELRAKVGLPSWIKLYHTRHEVGTKVCRQHGIFAASKILGHSDVSTTQRYTKSNAKDEIGFQDSFE